jgi:polyhydroxybutyrate depolymerase
MTKHHRLRLLLALIGTLMGLLALEVGGPVAPADGATCTLAPTNGLVSRTVGSRDYLINVPAGLTGREAQGVPLLLALHGLTHTPEIIAGYTPWQQMAASQGFIVVFPRGLNKTWDIHQGSPDVAYLRSVISSVSSTYCVDATHVHVTGDSMGAYMSQRMACDAADVVASVGEFAGGSPTLFNSGPCTPSRPIAVTLFHGTEDKLVRFPLGTATRDQWRSRNGCTGSQTTALPDGKSIVYRPCNGGVEVHWREYAGAGHIDTWSTKGADMSSRQWSFFMTFGHPTR